MEIETIESWRISSPFFSLGWRGEYEVLERAREMADLFVIEQSYELLH